MFGSSEDRARQLAFRKRRDRIISSSSHSTYRSVSSASHSSRHSRSSPESRTSSPTDESFVRIGQSATLPAYLGRSLFATTGGLFRMQQQTVQTERLGQVLYADQDMFDASDVAEPFTWPAGRSGDDGKADQQEFRSHHVRNVTAPITLTTDSTVLSMLPEQVKLALPTSWSFQAGTPFTLGSLLGLRGGGDNNVDARAGLKPQPKPKVVNVQPYVELLPKLGPIEAVTDDAGDSQAGWVEWMQGRRILDNHPDLSQPHLFASPLWAAPFTNRRLSAFIENLDPARRTRFDVLFGFLIPHGAENKWISNARRLFFCELDLETRGLLNDAFWDRFKDVEKECRASPVSNTENLKPVWKPSTPGISFTRLLEAIDEPAGFGVSQKDKKPSELVEERCVIHVYSRLRDVMDIQSGKVPSGMIARSTSTPDLRQRQQPSQGTEQTIRAPSSAQQNAGRTENLSTQQSAYQSFPLNDNPPRAPQNPNAIWTNTQMLYQGHGMHPNQMTPQQVALAQSLYQHTAPPFAQYQQAQNSHLPREQVDGPSLSSHQTAMQYAPPHPVATWRTQPHLMNLHQHQIQELQRVHQMQQEHHMQQRQLGQVGQQTQYMPLQHMPPQHMGPQHVQQLLPHEMLLQHMPSQMLPHHMQPPQMHPPTPSQQMLQQQMHPQQMPTQHMQQQQTAPQQYLQPSPTSLKLSSESKFASEIPRLWKHGQLGRRITPQSMDLALHVQDNAGYFGGGGGSNAAAPGKATLSKIFDNYRENPAAEPDQVGIEGCMKFFQDIDVDLEGLESFAALEVVKAPAMGEMSREGFVDGWQAVNCDTLDKQKAYIKNLKRQLPSDPEQFERIYKYVFSLALTGNSKQAPLDQAVAFWDVLFTSPMSAVKWTSPTTPWLEWWTEFVTSKYKKSITKDMWGQTLKFAKLTLADEAMTFWNEEASWPAVIDEFVDWVKTEKRGGSKEEEMDDGY